MALIACIECNKEISDKAKICPHCGIKTPQPKPNTWLPATILIVMLSWVFIEKVNTPESKEKARERDVIKMCWNQYENKALDPNSKRFVAKTCYDLESKYKNKYNSNP